MTVLVTYCVRPTLRRHYESNQMVITLAVVGGIVVGAVLCFFVIRYILNTGGCVLPW